MALIWILVGIVIGQLPWLAWHLWHRQRRIQAGEQVFHKRSRPPLPPQDSDAPVLGHIDYRSRRRRR